MLASVRGRLVVSYMLFTLLTISLIGVMGYTYVSRYIDQQAREYLRSNAEAVARQAEAHIWPVYRQYELDELVQTASYLGNVRVVLLNAQRRVLADSGPPTEVDQFVWIVPPFHLRFRPGEMVGSFILQVPIGLSEDPGIFSLNPRELFADLPPETQITLVERISDAWGSRLVFEGRDQVPVSEVGERSHQVISVPIDGLDRTLGFVEVSDGLDFRGQALKTIQKAFLFAAGGAVLLAGLVGLVVARWITAPLQGLTRVARYMQEGDLSVRAPRYTTVELDQLGQQFNEMATRLESSFRDLADERDSLRRFIADASHELRTPITAIKSFNELLQGSAAGDTEAQLDFLRESQNQIERLEWITGSLLDLSRLEAGLVALELADHHLDEVLKAVLKTYQPLAKKKGIHLSSSPPESPVLIRCDRQRIETALGNLVDNAVKFTPPGGSVRAGVDRLPSAIRLWVEDDGPGVSIEDQPHIFERYYRGNSSLQPGGRGLGLAIVKRVVEAHGGEVQVDSDGKRGARFTILLPHQP